MKKQEVRELCTVELFSYKMLRVSTAPFSAHGSSGLICPDAGASDDVYIPMRNIKRGGCKRHLLYAVPEQVGFVYVVTKVLYEAHPSCSNSVKSAAVVTFIFFPTG